MDEPVVDEPGLRALLDRAVACEPPLGPVAYQALEAGIRRRGRRRVSGAVACLVVAGVVGVTVPVVRSASVGPVTGGAVTIYAASKGQITPVWTATRTAGAPIGDNVESQDQAVLAATPDGKTLYVADTEMGWVTPISTATGVPGRPIKVGQTLLRIAITPNGRGFHVAAVRGVRGRFRGWSFACPPAVPHRARHAVLGAAGAVVSGLAFSEPTIAAASCRQPFKNRSQDPQAATCGCAKTQVAL